MTLFWLYASLLLIIAAASILRSLLAKDDSHQTNTEDSADLYQQRLQEIESDVKNGILSVADSVKVKKEAAAVLINKENANTDNILLRTHSVSAKTTAIILICFIPVFVISLYHYLGEPDLIRQAALLSDFNNAATDEDKNESVDKLLKQLEERLVKNPDDINGWTMLTNSYTALERYPDALRAVKNVYRLQPDDITVQLRYAEILSHSNKTFKGNAAELINKVLQQNSNNPNALWLAGLAANERGDYQQVINYWERLLPQMGDETGPKEQLQSMINSLKINLDQPVTETDIISKEPVTEEIKLIINVSLAPELEDKVNPDDTLFVYAKALEGPPMPLAIVKKMAKDLPLQVLLDDSSAMMPSNKLSDHKDVQIIARISKSGDAIQQSGDLIGSINKIMTNHNKIIDLKIYDKID